MCDEGQIRLDGVTQSIQPKSGTTTGGPIYLPLICFDTLQPWDMVTVIIIQLTLKIRVTYERLHINFMN